MAVKRLNIEIPWEQYELLRREAALKGTTVSGVLRDLIGSLKGGRGSGKVGAQGPIRFFPAWDPSMGPRTLQKSTTSTCMEAGGDPPGIR